MVPTPDKERELPPDVAPLSSGKSLFPANGLKKYNINFDVTYGVTLDVNNVLGGYLDGAVTISFFFFSQKFSQRIVEFEGFNPPPIELLNGGAELPIAEGLTLWRPQYPSVPFVDLLKLPALNLNLPENASIVADGAYNSAVGKKLFYEHFCTCREDGEKCGNSEECCNKNCDGPSWNKTCGGECQALYEPCQDKTDCCSRICGAGGFCEPLVK